MTEEIIPSVRPDSRRKLVDRAFCRQLAKQYRIDANIIWKCTQGWDQSRARKIVQWACRTSHPAMALFQWATKHRKGQYAKSRQYTKEETDKSYAWTDEMMRRKRANTVGVEKGDRGA